MEDVLILNDLWLHLDEVQPEDVLSADYHWNSTFALHRSITYVHTIKHLNIFSFLTWVLDLAKRWYPDVSNTETHSYN